jgi:hypothetical protein
MRDVPMLLGFLQLWQPDSDLPVQQATKTELIINLKTAKALGMVGRRVRRTSCSSIRRRAGSSLPSASQTRRPASVRRCT